MLERYSTRFCPSSTWIGRVAKKCQNLFLEVRSLLWACDAATAGWRWGLDAWTDWWKATSFGLVRLPLWPKVSDSNESRSRHCHDVHPKWLHGFSRFTGSRFYSNSPTSIWWACKRTPNQKFRPLVLCFKTQCISTKATMLKFLGETWEWFRIEHSYWAQRNAIPCRKTDWKFFQVES